MRWPCVVLGVLCPVVAAAAPPNVLLVMTDDQGYGELGVHGNPVLRTPRLDAFARDAVRLKNFYVSPKCSPTRASLLTGLYNYRTGIVDTYLGRSLMRPDVKTLAEMLAAAGYRTGLFGKWHLGDNYPLRPEDRGFQQTLWHRGGGLAQPADPPHVDATTAYFDPVLVQDGREVKTRGYCTDVFTDAAVRFIRADDDRPFFAYVAYNCPHSPFQVPEEYAARYRKFDLSENGFPKIGQPWATAKVNAEEIAGAYGMIENIDRNFGRLLDALEAAGRVGNTVVIFLTDNGVGGVRWNAGLRNRKGSVYEGGIRVPCYIRWPERWRGGRTVDTALAHIDVVPTLAAACGAKAEGLDGRDFTPLLVDPNATWPERLLFFQCHRGDEPEKYRAFAVRGPRYKLVQANGTGEGVKWVPKYELFDIPNDPFEQNDLAADKPEVVAELKRAYEAWFTDVTRHGFEPPRIILGNDKENPVRLSRQDWRGPRALPGPNSEGHWEVKVERPGRYGVRLLAGSPADEFGLRIGSRSATSQGSTPAPRWEVTLDLDAADARLEAWVISGGTRRGVRYVEVEYLGPTRK